MTAPPRIREETSRPPAIKGRIRASSPASPVKSTNSKNAQESATVNPSAARVPASATVAIGLNPWARYRLTKAMAEVATTATRSGSFPSSTDGAMKASRTPNVPPMPTQANTPRHRLKAITKMANRPLSQASGVRRSVSA